MRTPLPRLVALFALMLALVLPLPGTIRTVSAQTTPCADLIVTGITTNPAELVQGLPTTVTVTVKNQGNCAALASIVRWQPDPANQGLTSQVAGLDAGATGTVDFTYTYPLSGNFLSVVVVDTANTVNETNESNNIFISSLSVRATAIDLVVTDVTVAPERPVQGRTTTATVTVKNQGNFPAGAFVVQWEPAVFGQRLTSSVASLAPGASASVTFDFTYQLPGSFTSVATVDSNGQVPESDEFNNTRNQQVNVEPPLPDLIVADLTLNPTPPIRGGTTMATVTVQNRGHIPAGSFLVQWTPRFLAAPLTIQVNGLDAGASTSITFNYIYDIGGEFTSRAVVDSDGRVPEIDEFNNSKQLQSTVAPDGIDLIVADVTTTPAQPVQGQSATVNVTVRNDGNSPARNFVVEWTPDAFGILPSSPSTLAQEIALLGPGQTQTVSYKFVYLQPGNFRSIANVDARNNIAETNEANNLRLLDLTVQSAIDLAIVDFTIAPAQPVQLREATASIRIRNQGSFAAGNFFVQWKPAPDGLAQIAEVPGLAPGEERTVTLKSFYVATGSFTSEALVDIFNQVIESDEGNNTRTLPVTVVEPRARITITRINIIDDADSGDDPGDIQIFFIVNGQQQTFPSSGSTEIGSGDGRDVNISFELAFNPFVPVFVIIAAGIDRDDPLGPDELGVINDVRNAPGTFNNVLSTHPDGQFSINYRIEFI